MATIIGQYAPVFLPGEPPNREAWQAIVYKVTKSRTWPKWPCMHRHKTFLPVAALPQWELSVKVAHLLGLQGLWWRQVCRDTDCLHRRSYGPIGVFFWASCSWRSEDLFGQSFSVALPLQALRGLPCLGSFSVVWSVRHIEQGPPFRLSQISCFPLSLKCFSSDSDNVSPLTQTVALMWESDPCFSSPTRRGQVQSY